MVCPNEDKKRDAPLAQLASTGLNSTSLVRPASQDVLHCHEEKPLHIMIGGGDQLYNDPVWNLPALVQWLQIQDRNIRLAHPFTQEMSDQVCCSGPAGSSQCPGCRRLW